MGAEQKEQGDQKGSFCFVAVYDDRDDEQLGRQPSEDNEEDLEMILEEEEDNEASSSSAFDGSARSRSSSSLDMVDDASSSSLSTFSQSNRALYDLSQLMLNLPIKRGLSKFYQGKSQSFTSLARVTSLEDLPKKTSSSGGYATRMKACRSYGGTFNFNTHQQRSPHIISPKPTISKKSSSSSLSCLRGKPTTHRRSFKC